MIQNLSDSGLSTGPFAHSLAPLTRLLAHSLAPELVGQWNIFVQFSMCLESQRNDYEINAQITGPFTRPLAHSLAPHIHSLSRLSVHPSVQNAFSIFTENSSALLASLARSAALTRPLSHSLTHSLPSSWERGFCL